MGNFSLLTPLQDDTVIEVLKALRNALPWTIPLMLFIQPPSVAASPLLWAEKSSTLPTSFNHLMF